jgi:hypothetical protein
MREADQASLQVRHQRLIGGDGAGNEAHLINDFRAFAGINPTGYLAYDYVPLYARECAPAAVAGVNVFQDAGVRIVERHHHDDT